MADTMCILRQITIIQLFAGQDLYTEGGILVVIALRDQHHEGLDLELVIEYSAHLPCAYEHLQHLQLCELRHRVHIRPYRADKYVAISD